MNPAAFLTDLAAAGSRLLPEVVLLAGLVLVVLLDMVRRPAFTQAMPVVTLLVLLGGGAVLWFQPNTAPFFQRMLLTDAPARAGGLLVMLAGLLVSGFELLASNELTNPKPETRNPKLLLALVLGGLVLARAAHGMVLVLAIELLSIPSYALVLTNRRDGHAAEAALKYLLLGAVATGALLYGLSLLYGLTGSLHFADAAFWQNLRLAPLAVVVLAWALVLAGLLFKLGAAPLHFWVPDAYEGAPLPVALLLSTAPKAAAAVALWRLAAGWRLHLLPEQATALGLLLTGAALLSLAVGTLGALNQPNVRRLLGYSSIAQAGFLLLAIRAAGSGGPDVVLLYAAFLLLANGATFLAVTNFELRVASPGSGQLTPRSSLLASDIAGLGRRYPLPAVALTIGLVALTGLPPTVGFSAKLLAFVRLWEADPSPTGRTLLVTGILVTVASLFYYLRLPYWLFLKEPGAGREVRAGKTAGSWLAVGLAALLLVCFVKADWLVGVLLR